MILAKFFILKNLLNVERIFIKKTDFIDEQAEARPDSARNACRFPVWRRRLRAARAPRRRRPPPPPSEATPPNRRRWRCASRRRRRRRSSAKRTRAPSASPTWTARSPTSKSSAFPSSSPSAVSIFTKSSSFLFFFWKIIPYDVNFFLGPMFLFLRVRFFVSQSQSLLRLFRFFLPQHEAVVFDVFDSFLLVFFLRFYLFAQFCYDLWLRAVEIRKA